MTKLATYMAFEIREKVIDTPVRMLAMPGVRFEPGMVVKLSEFQNNIVCDISNGQAAFGIVGNAIYINDNTISFSSNNMLEIWGQRMVFRTNNCEPGDYETGDALYVSENGLLTIEKPFDDSYIVGRVISSFSNHRMRFEALWL